MNLRQIEVFKAVMSTGSVSDASRLLHVSVPAVSRVLSHTESRLGFPLFERVKGRLHPTAEARRLFLEVEHVYKGVQRIERLTHELAERRHGLLSVVSSPSIGQMIVPMALNRFHANHPGVRTHFDCLSYELLKERLLTRQVDVGVSILPVDHPNLQTVPIAASRLMCICQASHPLSGAESVAQEELLDYELITYPPHTPFGARVEQWFAQASALPRVSMEVGSPQNACSVVQAGGGVALVDEFSMEGRDNTNIVAIPVRNAQPIVADLVHLRTTPLSPVAEAFVQVLRSVLQERGLALRNSI
jgi:DNA-binding transcriptional LysR family regulator